MSDKLDWSSQLATAVADRFAEGPLEVRLYSVAAVSPEVVEIIYSDPVDGETMGIRIDLTSVRSTGGRIGDSTVDELALELVFVGMCEPKSKDEFLPPDENGVSWLRLREWLDEIS